MVLRSILGLATPTMNLPLDAIISTELKTFGDYAKERLGINSDNARYIKNKINKAFADFSNLEDLKQVQFEWFKKPSHRYEYGIHIKIEGGAMVQQNEMIIENTWREVKEDLLKKCCWIPSKGVILKKHTYQSLN